MHQYKRELGIKTNGSEFRRKRSEAHSHCLGKRRLNGPDQFEMAEKIRISRAAYQWLERLNWDNVTVETKFPSEELVRRAAQYFGLRFEQAATHRVYETFDGRVEYGPLDGDRKYGLDQLIGTSLEDVIQLELQLAIEPLVSWNHCKKRERVPEARRVAKRLDVLEFWMPDAVREGDIVTVNGLLAPFAPVFPGHPYEKRSLHAQLRQEFENIRRTRVDEGPYASPDQTILNAVISFTSGQMIWRLDMTKLKFVYMGLFEGIVRNSIPVFVAAPYMRDAQRRARFLSPSGAVRAEITARVITAPGLSTRFDFPMSAPYNACHCGERSFVLVIDDTDSALQTSPEVGIMPLEGAPQYLDGDIWTALRRNGAGDILTTMPGVNLSDANDYSRHRELLRVAVSPYMEDGVLLFEHDEIEKLQPGSVPSLRAWKEIGRVRDRLYKRNRIAKSGVRGSVQPVQPGES